MGRGTYKRHTKKQIERILTLAVVKIRSTGRFIRWYDVTKEFTENSYTKEYVYAIDLGVRNIRIIIFSSVDTNTDKTRDSGADMVRIIWEISNQKTNKIFKTVKNLKRIGNLENNMIDAILLASSFQDNKEVMNILNNRID